MQFIITAYDGTDQNALERRPYAAEGVWEKISVDRCNGVITKDGIV